jgi:hypothetical protein
MAALPRRRQDAAVHEETGGCAVQLVTFEMESPLGPQRRTGAVRDDAIFDLALARASLLASTGWPRAVTIGEAEVPSTGRRSGCDGRRDRRVRAVMPLASSRLAERAPVRDARSPDEETS